MFVTVSSDKTSSEIFVPILREELVKDKILLKAKFKKSDCETSSVKQPSRWSDIFQQPFPIAHNKGQTFDYFRLKLRNSFACLLVRKISFSHSILFRILYREAYKQNHLSGSFTHRCTKSTLHKLSPLSLQLLSLSVLFHLMVLFQNFAGSTSLSQSRGRLV